MTIAIYPGTFDPVHYGHIDIATRAADIFEQLVVAIYDHRFPSPDQADWRGPVRRTDGKDPLFSAEERVAMMRKALVHLPNVLVESYRGLTVEYARSKEASVIVRGLRVTYDFEYEYQRALTNKKLAPEIETLSLMTSLEYAFLSSSLVKEIADLGGCVQGMVPPHVEEALRGRNLRFR
ncbi:MAG: pantetheine-phosphate adenylyltransferase [Chloroflexota bacterium]|nr:pantetheine-phosphate adenylyltransferase [Chloroflexota bacterium]